jgi:XTP/dITP diphosphohydrolase
MLIVLATKNPHKVEEMRAILRVEGDPALAAIELRSAAELGAPEVLEDAPTLEGNARKKAIAVAQATGAWAIADDTGLEVDALGGAPGVFSARYAGPGATYATNCEKLLAALEGVPPAARGARFRCIISLASPAPVAPVIVAGEPRYPARTIDFEGILEGSIAAAPRGSGGFGYDPLFVVRRDARGRTLAELSADEKNRISHRARALVKVKEFLRVLASRAEAS